jgi:hypothetical protein
MQVFTTIFLAETLRANLQCVEEANELDQDLYSLDEFKQSLRERIAILEDRNWFSDGGFDDQ